MSTVIERGGSVARNCLRLLIAGAVVLTLGLMPTPAHAATSSQPQLLNFTYLVNVNSTNPNQSRCLAIPGGSTQQGVGAIQWTCNGGPEQEWGRYQDPNYPAGALELKNVHSNMCLAIAHGDSTPGLQAIQWPCNNGPEQRWVEVAVPFGCPVDTPSGHHYLNATPCSTYQNYATGRYLAVSGGSLANGAKVIQWTYSGTAEQQWVQNLPL